MRQKSEFRREKVAHYAKGGLRQGRHMAFCSYYNTFKKLQMFYYNYLIALAALVATGGFIYLARKPENAAFRFFDKDSFIACCIAAALIAAPFVITRTRIVQGSTLMFVGMWVLGLATYVGVGVSNVRRTRPVFGIIATLTQIAVFGIVFPIVVGWFFLKFAWSILAGMGAPDGYDKVNDPEHRFGVSDDELRKEGLYTPEKITPKSF